MDGELEVIKHDPYLKPFEHTIRARNARFRHALDEIEKHEGSLIDFARSYRRYGIIHVDGGISYREWAPGAKQMYLKGDFNNWNATSHPLTKDEFGTWSIFLPDDAQGKSQIPHGSKIKAGVVTADGQYHDRIPTWIHYSVQDPKTFSFDGVYWNPPANEQYVFKHPRPVRPRSLRIYEAHVGMASELPKVASFKEFARDVLPRIKSLGYTAVQLMAIMEHAYYASFGYHVTNFFAVSSRFGTPEEFKELVDTAHSMGILVLMDMVHSHASNNVMDGINQFDGTDHMYFHAGAKGRHDLWDSRLFNYNHWEVKRFLLGNVAWWMDEYMLDGFRFDGVTSILYHHHGLSYGFSGGYHEYFGESVDEEAVTYLMLANELIHRMHPSAVSIAEDVSGMPTLCRTVNEGGLGFDFRLGMAIPDKWIQLLKESKDEDWDIGNMVFTLMNRRWGEGTVAYAESHDQALVGDKTLAFWLMDKDMYDHMSLLQPAPPSIDRGIALHKMIRLITYALGGEAYLNFMGNEFGHPEWVDFPREGNNNSYHYARRQWSLAGADHLRYQYLNNFDRAMHTLDDNYPFLGAGHNYVSRKHEGDKVVVFERGQLLFAFNFHPTQSFTDYRIGTGLGAGDYTVVLDSDDRKFGGFGRNDPNTVYRAYSDQPWDDRGASMQVYLPCRSCLVYAQTSVTRARK
eukprot:TRINITY_DN4478_c0_g1::TRINITY_DN4478_c0_g1_i1::g.7249::m.7249 TRINITY_DN4478_c0_g1::TRINITY_DN4478_c0_g1_i1::g.7249  ORF type:complete len:706 (+),score=157.58,sp/Q96VA4/GLGB_ASPOR/58.63/0.0,Alpha-amylase_C/PF02806.13/6.9e+03,Alpha-amylase_C/PF02806.13/3.6e-23,Alpha-amylase/PF00128.19/9.9e-17,Alpha-amylase/PF00128.19/2.3,CBM_48/PF02922.13/1e-14 TRINITY_DN4478_c0_g1_i1:64-2118(+)